jgi:hypothetical protein
MNLPRRKVARAVPAVSQSATAAKNDPDEPEDENDILPWNEVIWLQKTDEE